MSYSPPQATHWTCTFCGAIVPCGAVHTCATWTDRSTAAELRMAAALERIADVLEKLARATDGSLKDGQ